MQDTLTRSSLMMILGDLRTLNENGLEHHNFDGGNGTTFRLSDLILRAIALRNQESIKDGTADFLRLQAQWREALKQIARLAATPG
jgi:hypothetical protein